MRILYKFPTRSRRYKYFQALDNIVAMARHTDYWILVTADFDDESMNNDYIINRTTKEYKNISLDYDVSNNKIHAINRGFFGSWDWDILILMSDDMEFIKPGFDLQIINDVRMYGPDILLHYPDQKAGHALITMAIMDREYYNRTGYIYNPVYKSFFCDNEQMEVAKKLGRYKFIKSRLFNHNHYSFGAGIKDAQYERDLLTWKEDKEMFAKRKAEGFI